MLVAEADLSQFLNCGSVFFVFFVFCFGPLQPPPPPKLQCTALSLMPFSRQEMSTIVYLIFPTNMTLRNTSFLTKTWWKDRNVFIFVSLSVLFMTFSKVVAFFCELHNSHCN